MEPIDHRPGHEIERLNREIEEQCADAKWTPASGTKDMLSALPGVESCACLWSGTGALDSVSQGNCLGFRDGSTMPAGAELRRKVENANFLLEPRGSPKKLYRLELIYCDPLAVFGGPLDGEPPSS